MKMGLSVMDINQMKRYLAEEEPPSVEELAKIFGTSVQVIKGHMPKVKPVPKSLQKPEE